MSEVELSNDDDVSESDTEDFDNHKLVISRRIRGKSVSVRASIESRGNTFTVIMNSGHFGAYLQSYDFVWSGRFNEDDEDGNPVGLGASFDGYAVVDKEYLTRGKGDHDWWNWVMMHEATHQYVIGSGIAGELFTVHGIAGGNMNTWLESAEWKTIEQVTNDLLVGMAELTGVSLPQSSALPGGTGAVDVTKSNAVETVVDPSTLPAGDASRTGCP